MGRLSVGATFQLGAKFGVGYSGGIRNAILISDMSVSSLARPHMWRTLSLAVAGRQDYHENLQGTSVPVSSGFYVVGNAMSRKAGTADLPLHGGHVPKWLADRMT